MNRNGIVRRIDDLGRITIPKEIRNSWGLEAGDPIEIICDRKEGIILRKYQSSEADILDDLIERFRIETFYAINLEEHDKASIIHKALIKAKELMKEAGY